MVRRVIRAISARGVELGNLEFSKGCTLLKSAGATFNKTGKPKLLESGYLFSSPITVE